MIVFVIAGYALLGMAAFRGVQAWAADQRLQRFRLPGESVGSYFIVPLRWRKDLYSREGEQFVVEVCSRMGAMYGYGIAGLLLFGIGSA